MSEVMLDPRWVPKEKCPLTGNIVSVTEFKETIKGRPYTAMRVLIVCGKEFYTYDAKFGDKNYLVNILGPQSDDWVGKEITISIDPETKYKRITDARPAKLQ